MIYEIMWFRLDWTVQFLFYKFTKFKPYENFCWFMNIFIEFFMEYPDIRIRYSVFLEPQEFEMDF